MSDTTPHIRLAGIEYTYPRCDWPVLNHLDLEIFPGERIGLVAPNGSGKTTLLHTIMGLCRPQAGIVRLFGKKMEKAADFVEMRSKIGLLFQDSDDQLFCPTVLDDVAFGPLNLGYSSAQALDTALKVLSDLGMDPYKDHVTHRLSGGQKRLVALAAVLAMKPEVLLLDEPTAGLDTAVKQKLADILNRLDITYFVISHEFDFLTRVTDRIFTMEAGRILTDEQVHIHQHEHIHRMGNYPHKHE